MKNAAIIAVIAAGICSPQTALFQQAETMRFIMPDGGEIFAAGDAEFTVLTVSPLTGSPFSATRQQSTLQILGDGTRIERTTSAEISRDSEGRTRTETISPQLPNHEPVRIEDPVAGASYILNPVRKAANKMILPKRRGGSGPQFTVTSSSLRTETARSKAAEPTAENLGIQNVNGIQAKGTRTTITIPVGEIGNDREIKIVSERWYSDELQIVVKSSNSDPRFGTTTVEMTGISRSEPSASLFQVPADYTITEPARRPVVNSKE